MASDRYKKRFANQEPFKFDASPEFACQVTEAGIILSWMAFDPRYGPESEAQIEWHRKSGTPGADRWEVGKPCKV